MEYVIEIPYKIIAEAIEPNMKYFNAASELFRESLFKATNTYSDKDCSSIDTYNNNKSFAETISNIPKIANNNKIGYSNKFSLLFLIYPWDTYKIPIEILITKSLTILVKIVLTKILLEPSKEISEKSIKQPEIKRVNRLKI